MTYYCNKAHLISAFLYMNVGYENILIRIIFDLFFKKMYNVRNILMQLVVLFVNFCENLVLN